MGRSNKKLLIAAVVLFSLLWQSIGLVVSAERLIFPRPQVTDKSITVEQAQETPAAGSAEKYPPANKNFLSANNLIALDSKATNLDVAVGSSDDEEDPNEYYYEGDYINMIAQYNAFVAPGNPVTTISQKPRSEVITYTVQAGDSASGIAASFGISLNTLLWANKLSLTSLIRPGDELTILPVSGILHRVKSQETIDYIAKYYQADKAEIMAFNGLSDDGVIQIGQKLVVPDGKMPVSTYAKTTTKQKENVVGPGTGKSHVFPYGQCTWYVAQKRYVPWGGNAKSWLANASAYGFQTGRTPQVGAIMVLTDGGWMGQRYGHVAYVEAVNGEWVTISEMNYICSGCRSVRTLRNSDWRVRGYVY